MCHLIVPKICEAPGFTEKIVFRKVFKSNLKKEWLTNTVLNPVFVKSVRFLGIFRCNRPEIAIWLCPKIAGLQGSEKVGFRRVFKKQFKQRMIGNRNLNPIFVKVWGFWAFFVAIVQNAPSDCSQNLRDSRIHRKDRSSKGFQKQFKERMIGNHNPESGFRQKCEVFAIFCCYRPECAIWLFPKICGTPGFTEKRWKNVFRKVFKSNLKKNDWQPQPWIRFLSKVWGFWTIFVAIVQNVPSDCSQNLRGSRIHRKDRFSKGFQKQYKERMIDKHSPESGFRQKCEVFGHFSLQSSRMCHLIVPKICGTPGFTEKDRFSKGFQKQFKERMIGNHNPESGFCQKCEVFGHFSLQSSRMCHLIVSKICGAPGFTEKDRFWKGFQKQFKERICKRNPESSFCQMKFLGIFCCYRPECAIWLFPKFVGLQDSQKKVFFERFTGNFKKEWLATTILNPVFVKSVRLLVLFSLLSPRMCHLIVPKNCGTPRFKKKNVFRKVFESNLI